MATTVTTGKIGTPLITLTAATEEVVSFADNVGAVDVISPSSNTVDAWFTVDGTAATVGGTNCYFLPAGSVASMQTVNSPTGALDQVRLISSGTPSIRVQQTSQRGF